MLAVIDTNFFMATMGSVVGEKITRAIELATETRTPLMIVAASAGARMEEGMFSLMQMAKTSAALARLHEARVLYISILTDPTLAGVTASFATLADVIVAEPQATIGFTGPRLIEQITHAKLPAGTHSAEFMLARGMVDCIVPRRDLRRTLARLIGLYAPQVQDPRTDGVPASRDCALTMAYEFEQALIDLRERIDAMESEIKNGAPDDATQELQTLRTELARQTEDVFASLSPWERVQLARHPQRPRTLDFIRYAFTEFVELHGDRHFGDDLGGSRRTGSP